MLQGPCNSSPLNFNGNANFVFDDVLLSSAAPFGNTFTEAKASPPDRQHDMWDGTVFTLPELGSEFEDFTADPEVEGVGGGSSPGCVPLLLPALGERPEPGTAAEVKSTPGHRVQSFVSSGTLSGATSMNGCNGGPAVSSTLQTPQTNLLSLSSLSSGVNPVSAALNGTATASNGTVNHNSNNNNSNNSNIIGGSYATIPATAGGTNTMLATGVYQQNTSIAHGMSGGFPTFFTSPQGGGNVMMYTSSPPTQNLCIPPGGGPAVFPYFVYPPPMQPVMDLNNAIAYSPVAATVAPPPIGTVMCGPPTSQGGMTSSQPSAANPQSMHTMRPMWTPSTVQTPQAVAPARFTAPAPIASGLTATDTHAAAPPPRATAAPATEVSKTNNNNNNNANDHSTNATAKNGNANGAAAQGQRGSPPSYDSLRLQLVKRRLPPGRQRSGTNVHGSLQGICAYYSYNLSAALKQYEQPDAQPSRPGEQVLPVFIQMFPCELRDRTIVVLNRVVLATCGPDIATVVGIEPRSETSFIALVRTNALWQLIHKLRCRVLMDRHGFWYAEDIDQYLRLKDYCESVRRLPQQMRHLQTDGLPCMPLVVELSRSINASAVTSSSAPPSFDEVAPIATVERHARAGNTSGSNEGDSPSCDSFSVHESG